VWVVVLARGYAAGLWVVVLFGALLVGTLGLWWHLFRHPPRLEVSHDAVRLWHGSKPRAQELLRASGELYIRRTGGRYPQPYLCDAGSDQAGIAMNMFDKDEVIRACEASGWRFRLQNPAR
jgi:hypothetical protein